MTKPPSSKKPATIALITLCLLLGGSFSLLDRHFTRNNKGFCVWQIYSHQPQNTSWDERGSSSLTTQELQEVFSQGFSYLGHGHQSLAFESNDGQFVLKFYRFPGEMRVNGWIVRPITRFKNKRRAIQKYDENKFIQTKLSHALSYDCFKEESALLSIHLEKSLNCPYVVTLTDHLHAQYTVPLKDTCFILQKKGELFFPTLDKLFKEERIPELKEMIHNVLTFIVQRSLKGLKDDDAVLQKNYGLLGTKLFQLDTGRLKKNLSLMKLSAAKEEARIIVEPLRNRLQALSPELLQYYNDTLEEI
ncbi:MAG: hypothetical protein NTX49_01450 [Chlamydiae bacterium]|nr:hypothetical protein [Chlamydiota bacterium]